MVIPLSSLTARTDLRYCKIAARIGTCLYPMDLFKTVRLSAPITDGHSKLTALAADCPDQSRQRNIVLRLCLCGSKTGWFFTNLGSSSREFIPLPYPANNADFDHHVWPTLFRGSLIDGMENLLDPAHPHLMHPRIVGRNPTWVRVKVERVIHETYVECTYHEAERRRGWLPALLEGQRLQGLVGFSVRQRANWVSLAKTVQSYSLQQSIRHKPWMTSRRLHSFLLPKGACPHG